MTSKQLIIFRRFARHLAPFLAVVLLSTVVFSIPTTTFAIKCITPTGGENAGSGSPPKCIPPDCEVGKICNPTTYKDINELLLAVVKEVMKYGLLLIVFFLVLAGFKFVVAQGNPEKISEAKKMLVWVIVGAFVLIGVLVIREAVCGTVDKIKGVPDTEPSSSDKRACPTESS